jgi:hypothetical protein
LHKIRNRQQVSDFCHFLRDHCTINIILVQHSND